MWLALGATAIVAAVLGWELALPRARAELAPAEGGGRPLASRRRCPR